MKALEIENFTKTYGNFTAVDSISFSIHEGEFFGFLGPNGAGKTTTINCATGISHPTSGNIRVYGHDVVRDYREARICVGLSFQEFNADIFSTPRDILYFVAGYYGIPRRERKEKIARIAKRLALEAHMNKRFGELSGGLKRRVVLARAMIHDPKLLILDEPTAGLDVEYRHELWRYLREINKAGKTILLTSHYLEEVELLCGTIAIINKGKIIAFGKKEELLSDGKSLERTYLDLTGFGHHAHNV